MASADSCLFTTQVALHGAGKIPALSAFLGFVSPFQAKALPEDAGTFGNRLPLPVISPGKLHPAWQTGLPG